MLSYWEHSILLACLAIVFVDSAPPFMGSKLVRGVFRLKFLGQRRRIALLKILIDKPFNCVWCMSFWIGWVYTSVIDINFIYYIVAVPIIATVIHKKLL